MTDIVIKDVQTSPYAGEEGTIVLQGTVIYGTGENDNCVFYVYASRNDLAATINTSIKNAAVAACAEIDVIVGALDKKTLMGGAVDL